MDTYSLLSFLKSTYSLLALSCAALLFSLFLGAPASAQSDSNPASGINIPSLPSLHHGELDLWGNTITSTTTTTNADGTVTTNSSPNYSYLNLGGTTIYPEEVYLHNFSIGNGTIDFSTKLWSVNGVNIIQASLTGTGFFYASAELTALTASNSYTGGNYIFGGSVLLFDNGTLGASNNPLTISSGGTLDLKGTTQCAGDVALWDGATIKGGTLSSDTSFSGKYGTNNFSASLTGLGNLTICTSDTTTLANSNSYTGGTTVSGTLHIKDSGTLGSTNNALAVTFDGILDLGGTTQTQASITVDGTIINGTIINATTGESTTYDSAENIVQPASN